MENFGFYLKLGFEHVLDPGAYDHVLFLAALALPFTFRSWKQVLLLASLFTIFHCISLAFAAYGVFEFSTTWIEFLIPVTIVITALFNFRYVGRAADDHGIGLHLLATCFFGLVHGFGFSNYFRMLVADLDSKTGPLLGFASGIELAQVVIVLAVLLLNFLLYRAGAPKKWVLLSGSAAIMLITIPLLIATFPF